MRYYVKFDENGEKQAAYPADGLPFGEELTKEQAQRLGGFELLGQEEFELYTSGAYVRGEDGRPRERAAYAEPIGEIRARSVARLKLRRDELEQGAVPYKGNSFDYDTQSVRRIDKARGFMQRNGVVSLLWTSADNERAELGVSDFDAIDDYAAIRSSALHEEYNRLKALVNGAATEDEVAAAIRDAFAKI